MCLYYWVKLVIHFFPCKGTKIMVIAIALYLILLEDSMVLYVNDM